MNLYTDLIKSKIFNGAIDPVLLKHSQEYNVLGVLRYFYPQKYSTMVLGEAPDLQDIQNCTGIEVTAAVSENDMKASRAFSQFISGKEAVRSQQRYINKIQSSGYSLTPISDNIISIYTTGTSNHQKAIFQAAIRKKLKKSLRYREKFANLGLAVVFPEIPTSDTEQKCMDWLREVLNEIPKPFDFVYIIAYRFCFYYDVLGDTFEEKVLSREDAHAIKTIARMTAEGELSLESYEWLE